MLRAIVKIAVGLAGIILFLLGLLAVHIALNVLRAGTAVSEALLIPVQLLLYAGIVALIERRRVRELGLRACLPQTGAGFLVGVMLIGAVIGILSLGGWYRVFAHGTFPVIGSALLVWAPAAIGEEVIFRGFVFRVLESAGGTWTGLLVSSALFGFAHAFNPGATLWSSLGIAVQAGFMLGLAYTFTRGLWLPIGVHIGWNFAEGTIFGTPVSGFHLTGSLLHGALRGPAIVTGGRFGIEASLEATLVCAGASVVLYVLAARERRIVPFGVNPQAQVETSAV